MLPKLEMKQAELNKEIYIEQFKSSKPHFIVTSDRMLDPKMIHSARCKDYFITFEYWSEAVNFIEDWFKSSEKTYSTIDCSDPNVLKIYQSFNTSNERVENYFTIKKYDID